MIKLKTTKLIMNGQSWYLWHMPQIQLLLGHIELLSITQRTLTIPLSTKSKTSELGLCGVHKFAEIFLNYALWYTSCLGPIKEKKPTITDKIH